MNKKTSNELDFLDDLEFNDIKFSNVKDIVITKEDLLAQQDDQDCEGCKI